jgi:predicted lipid-binding transport protein (Tim44 family)
MDQMVPYIEPDVLSGFEGAIKARKKEGHVVENRLVEIHATKLEEAEVAGDRAEITVRFESEIIAVVKDRYGKLLEGNMTDTIKVTDIWTFARHMKSKDPNWMLVATEAG